MKDAFKQDMEINDVVVFSEDSYYYAGRIVKFTPKMVRVRINSPARDAAGKLVEKSGTVMKDPGNLVRVRDASIEENLLKKDI